MLIRINSASGALLMQHLDIKVPVLCKVFGSIFYSWIYVYCACMLSCFSPFQLCVTWWTAACQAPLSMGFSRQAYWSGLPCPPPGDLPDPGIGPASLTSPALAGMFFTTSALWEAQNLMSRCLFKVFKVLIQTFGKNLEKFWPGKKDIPLLT